MCGSAPVQDSRKRKWISRARSRSAGGDSRTRRVELFSVVRGQALNLSERGLYFTAREKLSIGEALEIYLTIPRELTGRSPDPVRCRARVVHVDEIYPQQGVKGVGAIVDRYETVAMSRNWGN